MNVLSQQSLLAQAKTQAATILQNFAGEADFIDRLRVAFGDSFDENIALGIARQLQSGNFSLIPEIEVLSNGELGAASGAYAAELDKIFIASTYLERDTNAIANLLLEEIGHKIDRLLNGSQDSPGDEGDIFRRLVTGQNISPEELAALQRELDLIAK